MNNDTKTLQTHDPLRAFYETSYKEHGFGAQRRYPNEEFCRFLGSNWLNKTSPSERAAIRLLEVGAGSGANLWMAAREGFETYGLELTDEGVALCKQCLKTWNVKAEVQQGDMTAMPYGNGFFDVVCDIFSAYCLPYDAYCHFLKEVRRVLKTDGKFFFYTPSTNSAAFLHHEPAKLIDPFTLDGIRRESSPYFGNFYPFRFLAPDTVSTILEEYGFSIANLEVNGRTYNKRNEYFEFVVCTAIKK